MVGGYSAIGGSWDDCHGHGTHVAGTGTFSFVVVLRQLRETLSLDEKTDTRR